MQLHANSTQQSRIDTGLFCLAIIAKLFQIPAEAEQLRRAYAVGEEGMDFVSIQRAAKDLNLKSRQMTISPEKITKLPLPAMLQMKNGQFIVFAQTDGKKAGIIDPSYKNEQFVVPLEKLLENFSGEALLFTRRFTLPAKFREFGLGWFLPVIFKYKRFFWQVLGISFLLQLFGLVSPLFSQVIIDKVLVHRSSNTLDILVLGMLVVSLFQVWITGLRSYLFSYTTSKIDVALSSALFRHITALPIQYFEKWQTGEVVSRVGEVENIRTFITGSSLTIVLDILFALVYVAVMFVYSGMLSLVALLAVPVFIVLNLVIAPAFRRVLNEQFLVGAEKQTFLIEAITGIQTVKSGAIEPSFVQKYEEILARFVSASFSAIKIAAFAGSFGTFVQQSFNLAILWVGARAVMDGNLSVGQLIAFQMLAGQVVAPILRLVNMWQYFQKTRVSIDRLGDIMNDKQEPAFDPSRTTLPEIHGDIHFDRVTFRYRHDAPETLHQISLHIPAGAKIGIVGRSGSGKSTLTKLIQRMYVPESGRVLIDNVDMAQVEPAWLRRQIGVVLQETFLFSGSIRENIATGDESATEEAILSAAETAGAHEFIMKTPRGYDTFVGERGSLLSGGQKQRLSIARALLLNPKILIFDEATSALDYESEKIIMDNLDRMAAGRTMIMIAHRLSTVRHCDKIIVMDRGRIIEEGTHEELLAGKGHYHYLYTQQEQGV